MTRKKSNKPAKAQAAPDAAGKSAPPARARLPLAAPPLLSHESPEDFEEHWRRMSEALAPEDAIEDFWARNLADLTWDVLRHRSAKVRLLNALEFEGLTDLIRDHVGPGEGKINWPGGIDNFIIGWRIGIPEANDAIDDLLERLGLGMEDIADATLLARQDDVDRLERLIVAAEGRIHATLREVDRRRSALIHRARAILPVLLPPPTPGGE